VGFIRKTVVFTTLFLGSLCVLIAYANLYNIDEQPRSFLAAYAFAGILLIGIGVSLILRSRRRAKSAPPAP
jgi:hypothetical protein